MDVSKLFAKSEEQGETVPSTGKHPLISKQKNSITPVEEVDRFEDEGGAVSKDEWVTPEEITEVLIDPTKIWEDRPTVHPLYKTYNRLVQEVIAIRDKKGKDYGTPEDPFANVRGAQDFGVKPWIGAANSANDCLTRIKQYAKTGKLENESVRDSMIDLANYALICLTLWEEENGE